jgi:hypothetical protein
VSNIDHTGREVGCVGPLAITAGRNELLDHDPNCKAGGDALDQALKIAEGFADPYRPRVRPPTRRCDTARLGRRQEIAAMMPSKVTETS